MQRASWRTHRLGMRCPVPLALIPLWCTYTCQSCEVEQNLAVTQLWPANDVLKISEFYQIEGNIDIYVDVTNFNKIDLTQIYNQKRNISEKSAAFASPIVETSSLDYC